MERQLSQLIESMLVVSDVQNLDAVNPITHRLSNNTIRKVTTVVCALREPVALRLPLNVIWFNYDPRSAYYKKALQRVSKEAPGVSGFQHTWKVIETMEEYNADQFYDEEDSEVIGGETEVPPASMTTLGIVKLSVAPANANNPVAVGEGDPRLSDAREPLYHTHPEIPATMIQTRSGRTLRINTSVAPVVGATLVYQGNDTVIWRQLTTSDVQQ